MKDIISPLRKAIFAALQATGEAVFYQQAPDQQTGNYITFKVSSINEIPLKTGSSLTANVDINIYTESEQYNDGNGLDTIAGKVYLQIYPTPGHVLPLASGFQMVSTDLVSDQANNWKVKNQTVTLDRTITFKYRIFVS